MVNSGPNDGFPLRAQYPTYHYSREVIAGDNQHSGPQEARRPLPMTIDKAMRDHCHINASCYVLAVIKNDGTPEVFSAPLGRERLEYDKFMDLEAFAREVKRIMPIPDSGFGGSNFGLEQDIRYSLGNNKHWATGRQFGAPVPFGNFEDDGNHQTRKRPRATISRRVAHDYEDLPQAATGTAKRGIMIGNDQEVWSFYDQRFKNCQQNACKLIAKAWVKAVEPKKQSAHPYTGKDEKAPEWWPKPWGPTKEEKVRHREPDHLYKHERVHLLQHILRMVVEPNQNQHPSIKHLGLNLEKLEEVTYDALSSFFADREQNKKDKKGFLKEIFRVARQEERFKNDEIDGTTVIYVNCDDRYPDQGHASENEDFDARDDDTESAVAHISSTSSPQGTHTSQTMMSQPQSTVQSPSGHLPVETFHETVRGAHFTHPVMNSELASERPGFVEGPGVAGHGPTLHPNGNLGGLHEMYPSPHDHKRSSVHFHSPTDYENPATTGLYQPWPGSSSANSPAIYPFPHSPTTPAPAPFVGHSGIHVAPNNHYMGTPFDGLPRGDHAGQQGGAFRSSGIGQAPLSQQSNYADYIPQISGSTAGSSVKHETIPRHMGPQQ
ncbi:hypothetical protein F5Y15DRAFT_257245 [Xylariaceae sp. FL0016]|nr:hypothetical protein F5Y15DRAFT_257245 [Xylariaceae sp. FL0016]